MFFSENRRIISNKIGRIPSALITTVIALISVYVSIEAGEDVARALESSIIGVVFIIFSFAFTCYFLFDIITCLVKVEYGDILLKFIWFSVTAYIYLLPNIAIHNLLYASKNMLYSDVEKYIDGENLKKSAISQLEKNIARKSADSSLELIADRFLINLTSKSINEMDIVKMAMIELNDANVEFFSGGYNGINSFQVYVSGKYIGNGEYKKGRRLILARDGIFSWKLSSVVILN